MTPKKPAKKPAARKRPAAVTPQVDRHSTTTASVEETPSTVKEPVSDEETQEQRDAAGAARREKVLTPGKEDVPDYELQREPLEHADFDHQAAEEQRQAELQAERDEHNERTGDASLAKGTWT